MNKLQVNEIGILTYQRPSIRRGYANQTLHVDLSDSGIAVKPVNEKMKEVFIGGKGLDLWLMWNAVKGTTRWNDPENAICIASGPLGGTPIYPGLGQEHRHFDLPHHRFCHGFERGRLLRPLPQVLGVRRPRDPGQGRVRRRSFSSTESTGRSGCLEMEGLPEEAHEISRGPHRLFRSGKAAKHLRRLHRARCQALANRMPQFLLVRLQRDRGPGSNRPAAEA